MNWIFFAISFLAGAHIGVCWMIWKLTKTHLQLRIQHELDMQMVKKLFDNHLARHESECQHSVQLLRLLQEITNPHKE